MDALMGFVQVDAAGLPAELPAGIATAARERLWQPLADRLETLSQTRGATAGWIGVGFDRP
jgi:hypothetical protein